MNGVTDMDLYRRAKRTSDELRAAGIAIAQVAEVRTRIAAYEAKGQDFIPISVLREALSKPEIVSELME